ncbi:MAG TPA: hypothetical protein VFX16_09325 [Pseudonocardiaceae bacterium]|nr:hypothetical protein [Pseudonocardiaceae bacterium]
MTHKKTDGNTASAMDRRGLLRNGLMLGGAAALAAPLLGAGIANAAPDRDTTTHRRADLILDIAMDGPSLLVNPGPNVDFGDLRGSTFYVEGPIYPGLTIPDESSDWDATKHTDKQIGFWFGMGQFMLFPGRPNPHLYSVHTYVFGDITPDNNFPVDQISSIGTEASLTQDTKPSTRSISGGCGKYFSHSGQISLYGNGSNVTIEDVLGVARPAPNLRLFFYFDDDHSGHRR